MLLRHHEELHGASGPQRDQLQQSGMSLSAHLRRHLLPELLQLLLADHPRVAEPAAVRLDAAVRQVLGLILLFGLADTALRQVITADVCSHCSICHRTRAIACSRNASVYTDVDTR